MMNVIDFRARLRTKHMLKPWDLNNPAKHFEQYIKLYRMEPRLSILTNDEYVQNMHSQGVNKAVVCSGSIEDNDHLLEIANLPLGTNFFMIAGVHPKYGIRNNIEEIIRCHKAGFLGVNFSPYIWGVKANDKALFPLYAYCEANNLIAIVHGSLHYNRFESMWLGDPKYMDDISIHFPNLKLVISHAGNGFGVLGLAVAQKHPNIFLEFSALWPKYLPDATIHAINTYLKDRCLFGTDYPLVDFNSGIKAWTEAIVPDVRELFFEKNALKCLFGKPV